MPRERDLLSMLEDDDGTQESEADGGQAEEAAFGDEGSAGTEAGAGAIGEEGDDAEGQEGDGGYADLGGPPASRRETRIRNLNRRLQDQTRRNEDLERRLNMLESNRQQQPQQQQISPEEEQARMQMMTPEERMNYTLDRGMRQINSMTQSAQIQAADNADRAAYAALASQDRLALRFAPQVEQVFATLKQQGRMTGREMILKYLVGEAAMKAAGTGKVRKQRTQAQTRINQQRVNSGAGRSDVGGERRRGGQSLEQRLEGKLI